MRIYLLWALVFGCVIYAWRNWFVSLCALILLSVVMQRRDFPSYLLGIDGLNPWNLLFLMILLVWLLHRRSSSIPLGIPKKTALMLVLFWAMIFISYLRAVPDHANLLKSYGFVAFTGEFLINPIKFAFPALLLFDACRTRRRIRIAAGVIFTAAVAYALLVIKFVPITTVVSISEEVVMQYRHRIDRDVGLMAIDMSMLLAGMFWALLAFALLAVKRRSMQLLLLAPLAVLFLGIVLCHSRGSYVGFAVGGLVLALARWRWLLLVYPVIGAILFAAFPAIPTRIGMGFGIVQASGQQKADMDDVTSGRMTHIWPAAIEQISKGPLLGFGGKAFERTEARTRLEETHPLVGHPHSAYLEMLLDMGVVGLLSVLVLYGGIFVITLRLFRNRGDPLAAAIGGMGLACISVLLVSALGTQSFYPTQSTILYWSTWGLALRMHVDRAGVAPQPVAAHHSNRRAIAKARAL